MIYNRPIKIKRINGLMKKKNNQIKEKIKMSKHLSTLEFLIIEILLTID